MGSAGRQNVRKQLVTNHGCRRRLKPSLATCPEQAAGRRFVCHANAVDPQSRSKGPRPGWLGIRNYERDQACILNGFDSFSCIGIGMMGPMVNQGIVDIQQNQVDSLGLEVAKINLFDRPVDPVRFQFFRQEMNQWNPLIRLPERILISICNVCGHEPT